MSEHPHTIAARQAEEIVIGGLIQKPENIHTACEHIDESDFSDKELGSVFLTMKSMLAAGEPLHERTILTRLQEGGVIERIGTGRLAKLIVDGLPHHTLFYSEEIAKHAAIRRLEAAFLSAIDSLNAEKAEPQEIASNAQNAIIAAAGERVSELKQAGEICEKELERLEGWRTNGESGVLSTGIPSVDRALDGGLPVGVSILAARPSIGKSSLAMEIGYRVAKRGEPVLFVSLEMSDAQNAHRLFSRESGLPIGDIQAVAYDDQDVLKLMKAATTIRDMPLTIWQAAGASAAVIESRIRIAKAKYGIRLAIVDYLGLVRGGNAKASIYEKVTENSLAFATMAKRLDLPILLLSQLSRAAEVEVPELHHLRDSGAIEQDADVIAFIHRDSRESEDATLYVAKKRQGRVCQTDLRFSNGWFSDPTEAFAGDFATAGACT